MFWKRKRPSEVTASERARLLSSWPAGDYSWPRTDQLEGWSAHDIYLLQDALLSDAAAFPSKKFGPDFAMIYLLGRRAALRGLSLKLLPWQPVSGPGYAGPSQEWVYLTGFVDALADKVCGTDRVPPEIKELYPDYLEIDVERGGALMAAIEA
jgi:hypothetical protein